ncbi:hypothetical protein DAMA08_035940 [Martiniozyma asiatica (nom. inval.)]|nr:hypothetical protein DAMA08_035940 [Martiniozyma asiatica]
MLRLGIPCYRPFSTSSSLSLIYKRASKLKKTPPKPVTSTAERSNDPLANHKYYQRTPQFFKKHMRTILLNPYSFVFSIAFLQQTLQLSAFLMLWCGYWYFDSNLPTDSIFPPQGLIDKGKELISSSLANIEWDESLGDKERVENAGTRAYAGVKAFSLGIWAIAIWCAPGLIGKSTRFIKFIKNRSLKSKIPITK